MNDNLEDFPADLKHDLMVRLYQDWFTYEPRPHAIFSGTVDKPRVLDVNCWLEQKGISRHDAYVLIQLYVEKGLVELIHPHYAQLTGHGVKFCENSGYVDEEKVKRSNEIAIVMLQVAALITAEQRSARLRGGIHIGPIDGVEQLINEKSISKYEEDATVRMLENLGLVDRSDKFRGMQITEEGQSQLSKHLVQLELRQKYEILQTGNIISPQKRGHELEALLEIVLTHEDWNVETNVRTTGQEHDLIINRYLEYYMLSCKWENKRTQQRQIGELRDRVTARPGMRGIFVSIGGFTTAAINDTASRLEVGLILLYGPHDIENVMRNNITFSDLLSSKYRDAVVGRNILVDSEINQSTPPKRPPK